jgi:hypothetical protein
MRHTTITSVNQLRAFVPGITDYVAIYYESSNISNHYFGDYDESVQLDDNNVTVRRQMITDSRMGVHDNLISYVLSTTTGNTITISYRDRDIEDDNIRIDILESDTQVLLVVYHRYIENHHHNHHHNHMEDVNIENQNNIENMNQNNIENNFEEDNQWNMIQNNPQNNPPNHLEDFHEDFEE